jgi:LemA protein
MLNSRWFWIAIAILVFWVLGAYNRLVRLRTQVKQQFGPLETVLLNYQELVQHAVAAATQAPQLWDGLAGAELSQSHWTRLQVAAGLSTVAIARMQTHTLEEDSARALHDAAAELQDAWAALIHPDVYYINMPEALKQRWLELDLLVQPELTRFNEAIADYNHAIAQYPAALLARLFQFTAATPL